MKIKIKDLTDDLVDALNYYKEDCCDLCLGCSFFDEDLNFLNHPCVCMFIKVLRIQTDLENYEIDLESMLNEEYDSVLDMCKALKLDPKFIDELRETIERKERVKKDLQIVGNFIKKNFLETKEVRESFENIVSFIEENC